jgi:hypothetical protein
MSADPTPSQGGNLAIAIATALMCALAAGAVWCVLQLYLRLDLIGIAIVIGAFIAWVLRRQGFGRRLSGALIAAFSTLLACLYAGYLLAAAKVASFLGVPMRNTLTTMGLDMAGAIAWADLTVFHLGTLVLAVVLSAWLVWRKR